ncbi:unnamed protein product [Brassica oleracea]
MAEHLASIYGTEKDRVNCPFYNKMGACRHGDRCSRIHNRVDPRKIQEHFEDLFEELRKLGEIESLNICDNLADHMIGNVYVQFKEEDQAAAALQALQGRSYLGRPIIGEFSPVTDFREATCRQYEEENCRRGGIVTLCILITGTEIGSFTGMEVGKKAVRGRREEAGKGTVLGGDREALVVGEKEARREGRGLSNGTDNVRRRKREEQKHNSDYNFCHVVGSAVCFSALAESFGCANMVT